MRANLFQLSAEGGTIYNYCRNQNFNPSIYTSTDGGFGGPPPSFSSSPARAASDLYMKYASDNVGRVDFLYTDGHPRDIANSLYHLYYTTGRFTKRTAHGAQLCDLADPA